MTAGVVVALVVVALVVVALVAIVVVVVVAVCKFGRSNTHAEEAWMTVNTRRHKIGLHVLNSLGW